MQGSEGPTDSQGPPLPLSPTVRPTGHPEAEVPPHQLGLSVKHASCLPNRAGFTGVQHMPVAHAEKGSGLGLMLCSHHLEILAHFLKNVFMWLC